MTTRLDTLPAARRPLAALFIAASLPLLFLPAPALGPGWDAGMALGAVAAGLAAVLPASTARQGARDALAGAARGLLDRLHRDLSFLLLALIAAHTAAVLVLEPQTVDWLLPAAPAFMLAALAATALLVLLVATSLARRRAGWSHPGWRRWHALMSAGALGLMAWHVLGAGYYVAGPAEQALFVMLVAGPTVSVTVTALRPRAGAPPRTAAHGPTGIARLSVRATLAAALWWILAALLLARGAGGH